MNYSADQTKSALQGQSLHETEQDAGYAVEEAESRFPRERLAENALRLVAAFLILGGYLQWLLHDVVFPDIGLRLPVFLTGLFVGTGLLLYIFAGRGVRRAVQIDMGQRRIVTARVNSKGQSMIRHSFAMADVESLFVHRPGKDHGVANLKIRVAPLGRSISLLAGDEDELRALHARLSRDIRKAMDCTPKRVKRASRLAVSVPRPPARHMRKARQDRALAAE